MNASVEDEIERIRKIIAQGSYAMNPEDKPYQDVAERLYAAGVGFVPREAVLLGNPSPIQVRAASRAFFESEHSGSHAAMREALLAAVLAEPLLLSPVKWEYGVQYLLSKEAHGADRYGYYLATDRADAESCMAIGAGGVIVRRVAAGPWELEPKE